MIDQIDLIYLVIDSKTIVKSKDKAIVKNVQLKN